MKRLISALLYTLVLAAIFGGSPLSGQSSQTTASTYVQLGPIKQLRKDVDAWPLIVAPDTSAAQHINTTLALLNQQLAQSLLDCDADYRQWLIMLSESGVTRNPASDKESAEFSRIVQVTMTGPRFLSLVGSQETFCGGAHPDSEQISIVFDMTTGATVNWVALLPKSAQASAYSETASDGSTVGALILPALRKSLVASATADCKDAFLNPQPFLIWPDAKREVLVTQPFDLPTAVLACANEIDLTIDQARKLGFDGTLLTAIEQAHRQTGIDNK